MKWIKLSVDIFDDEKIQLFDAMPERDTMFVIWVRLLTLAAKCDGSGVVYLTNRIPYTDEMLATLCRRELNIVRLALETFRQFEMIEIEETGEIQISNWGKYQNADALQKMRDQNRLRQQRHRDRLKAPCHTDTEETPGDIEEDIEGEEPRDHNVMLPHSPKRPGTIEGPPRVYITPDERLKLCEVWTSLDVEDVLNDLSDALGNRYRFDYYKNHYQTAQNWLRRNEKAGKIQRRPDAKYCANCKKPYEGTVCTACGVEE